MEILNPKVGTVPKQIRDVFLANNPPRALFSVMENRVCFGRRFKTIIKNLKRVGAGKFLKIMLKNRTYSRYASNFFKQNKQWLSKTIFKLDIMQSEILNF